jgi:hypothetical protein
MLLDSIGSDGPYKYPFIPLPFIAAISGLFFFRPQLASMSPLVLTYIFSFISLSAGSGLVFTGMLMNLYMELTG